MFFMSAVDEEDKLDRKKAAHVLRRSLSMLSPYRRQMVAATVLVTLWTFTVLAGATVTNTGALQNDGTIFLDPSTLIAGDLMGTGFVTIDTGSTLEVQGAIAAGETIAFIGGASYAHFDSPAKVAGSVSNLDLGDAIDLKGVDKSSIGYDGSVLSFTGGSFPLSLAADVSLQVTGSGDGALLSALSSIPSYSLRHKRIERSRGNSGRNRAGGVIGRSLRSCGGDSPHLDVQRVCLPTSIRGLLWSSGSASRTRQFATF